MVTKSKAQMMNTYRLGYNVGLGTLPVPHQPFQRRSMSESDLGKGLSRHDGEPDLPHH